MYTGNFGQNRRPFASVPLTDNYFPAASIENARTTLVRCIQRGEGVGMVVGPSGTGKTLLCLMLAEQFRNTFQAAMLASGRLSSRKALFQAILYELGRPYRDMDEGELRLALIDYLNRGDGNANGIVLLVDEAHTLPLRLLDEIRLLSNQARNGQPLVRLVLFGSPALEERFASPKLDSFNQRLSARCYLEPFNRTETREYIQSRVDSPAIPGEEFFPEDTCQSVFQVAGGVPRLINQVCDHALLLARVAGRDTIEPATVEEAWADLQQLPAPCNAERTAGEADRGVIEFGSLDDSTEKADSGSQTAVFRVASVEDEGAEAGAGSEPEGQIHRIERLLARADEDFQPAGSIGPEVELDFDEAIHPFQEKFEQEEIVSDRYAAARAKQPLTFGTSAYAIEFEPAAASSGTPNVCIAEEPETEREANEEERPVLAADARVGKATFDVPLKMGPSLSPVAGRRVEQPAARASSDDETRRHEYRQLFSRLRRG